jgi:predicted acetyltransferase
VAVRIRTVRDLDEFRDAVCCIGHYFGWEPEPEDVERFARILPLERVHVAIDGGQIVGAAGAYPLELTVPAGVLPCAGPTLVGVLPSHRRRGLLRRMMEEQIRDVRQRAEPIAALWASEETIYGRFGYGMASFCLAIRAEHAAGGIEPAEGHAVRLVGHEEASRTFPRVYDRVRRRRVGFFTRSHDWWETRQLGDREYQRRGAGPLQRALLERHGRPVGFALYRIASERATEGWKRTLRVSEAFGVDAAATREIWRFLLSVDWVDEMHAHMLPLDHPLLHLVRRPNDLRARVWDGLWIRIVDVAAALGGRGYAGDGRVHLEVVSDPIVPENAGTWTVEGGVARRSRRRPDVRLAVQELGAVFLGGFSFAQLARAGRVEEVARGGLSRADGLFATDAAPWCPENI